jgi:hypothetical protein
MSSWIKKVGVTFCNGFIFYLLIVLILPADAFSETGTSYIKWSISGNVDHYFSPLRLTNKDLKKAEYPEITSTTPQLGLELARFKYDPAWNAKRSLSFMYIYWQGKGSDGDYRTKIYFHEFFAIVRVYLLRHLLVSPFLGCGLGFQSGTIKTYTPFRSGILEGEFRNTGGVLTILTGIEWQSKSRGGLFRLEGGYRHIPIKSVYPRGVRMNTSCWFLGATAGIKMPVW